MAIASDGPTTLKKTQLAEAGAVLGRAFHTNPGFVWGVPDEVKRAKALPWFMETAAKLGDKHGVCHTTPEGVEGAAIWLPPGKTYLSLPQLLREGFYKGPFKFGVGSFMKFVTAMSKMEELHKETMKGDHWYLFILGVDPPRQGQGVGSALIQGGLNAADGAGVPCYLETDKIEDVAFYEKQGFKV